MKRLDFGGLAVGVALGAGAMVLMGQTETRPAPFQNQSVQDVLYPRRQEGVTILGDGTSLAPFKLDMEELMPLVDPDQNTPGRYQVLELGDKGEFLLLDTANGLTRHFTEGGQRLRIYNARVPNHVITTRVRLHSELVD